MLSTSQLIVFIFLPTYLLVFTAGYLIARWNRGRAITTLGLAPKTWTPFGVSPTEGLRGVLAIAGSLVLLPLLPLFLLLLLPYLLVLSRVQRHREVRFAERMKLTGRVIRWPDAQERLWAKQGTLICETFSMHGVCRFWWAPDDVAAISPFPFVRLGDRNRHRMEQQFWAFGQWCHERYTNEASGSAFLLEQPRTRAELWSFQREAADVGYIESYCSKRGARWRSEARK